MKTRGALAGRRILEIADESGAYCGKLLADLGAEVIKIEPPGGDPTRTLAPLRADGGTGLQSFFFAYMHTNKRSLVLDLASTAGRDRFHALAASADAVLETRRPGELAALGLGYEELRAR